MPSPNRSFLAQNWLSLVARPKRIRTAVFAVIVALLGVGGWLRAGAGQTASAHPNVVVFFVDDMGVMDTSVPFLTDGDDNGNPKRYPLNDYYNTPSLEQLAEQGIRFNNFYAMSVCSPSRISLMTGQNAARHRTTNWINPDRDNGGDSGPPTWNWGGLGSESVTLARLLQRAGYRTIHIGKGHFGPRDSDGADPTNLGFDVNVGGHAYGQPGSYYAAEEYGSGTRYAVPDLDTYHGSDTFLTEALTLEAKSHVTEAVRSGQPFFLYLSHYAVHAPFDSDPRFAMRYRDSDKPPPAQAFATLIEGIDKSLGDILGQLDALGVSKDTLVFFLGDNGSDAPLGHEHRVASSAPLRGKKGSHYEGGVRVPFIAAWAELDPETSHQKRLPIASGTVQSQTASIQDLFPTILALVDEASPTNHIVDGRPLQTLLAGRPDTSRDETFLMHYPHGPHRSNYFTTYRDGDWKVIYHYLPSDASEGSHYQLYNLAEDPFEQTNLASARPRALRRMMEALVSSLEHHGALYPVDADGETSLTPKLPVE